jgi:putative membrane protein
MSRVHITAAIAFGAALAASSAFAQPGVGGQPPTSPRTPGAQMPQPVSPEEAERASRERKDRGFLENAVQRSHAQIEGSKLALEKSENPDVKAFATKMVENHEQMARQAAQAASAKGLTPPEGPSLLKKTEITALRALSGGAFDNMYLSRIGIAGHEAAIEMFERAGEETQDPEVKTLVDGTLPKLREHLQMAQALKETREKQESQARQ